MSPPMGVNEAAGWRSGQMGTLLGGSPIGRGFEVNPAFNFHAATIMTLTSLGYDLTCFDDLCASAFRAASKLD
jgi:hypothetical protein